MSETETEKKQITDEEKRDQVVEIVEEAEAATQTEGVEGYPPYGHATIAYFASKNYVRVPGVGYVLKSEVEKAKKEKRDF